jgi:hypothetical protein
MSVMINRLKALLAIGFVFGALTTAYGSRSYLNTFLTTYPATSSSQLNSCLLCHTTAAGGGARNSYGADFANNGHNFKNIESLDSDKDGFTNISEIVALTFPGDASSHPGTTTTDSTPPTVTSFAIPSSSNSLTVLINILAATDNIGVTGYLITESSTKPSATASGWTPAPPSSYTFSSAGSKTLYAWAKDAAGNVSSGVSASTTITLLPGIDTTAPTVMSFSLPASAHTLTVAILSFSASDNVAVTGYLVTESASTPAASAPGWASSPPSNYTFASAGAKTLYGWAKDAAGNVSASVSAVVTVDVPVVTSAVKSITSTSQNRSSAPQQQVAEQPYQQLSNYQVLAANDLGMHCGDLDQRIASILPPYNVLHAQVVQKGHVPRILDQTQVEVVYSAASSPLDPALAEAVPPVIYKTNFWDENPRTGNPLAFDAYDAYYPPGILKLFPLLPDVGLPAPDLQRLYFGDGRLAADQQALPSMSAPLITQPYAANVPQPFALFYRNFPFFVNFLFGYSISGTNWFSAEGIPLTPFDDLGRSNPYPLMRVQARAVSGNSLSLKAGTVMSSLDTVTPVSGEVDCRNCHTSAIDGGSGIATDGEGFQVATRFDDPQYGQVPEAVSIEYAYDINILRLHDRKHGTNLQSSTPVSCQRCHYTPALDLAHLGPQDVNGREQTSHQSFSRVMHGFHGSLGLFPEMPSPVGRSSAVRDSILGQTCYQCHPGAETKCFRGAMFNAGQACQDCHGNMSQVGNDFSKNVSASTPGKFIVAGDFYTNANTPRVPWANEPLCQSCHTGDVLSNLAGSSGVLNNSDGLRLVQTYRTGDANAKPIVATNRRFAENQTGSGNATKQVLYRLSRGHGGIFCEGCHGSTHAEWPNATANANDNLAATQLQGHDGKIMECSTCHGSNTFSLSDFRGNFDANGWMKGPHGMHPVNDRMWIAGHHDVFEDRTTPAGACQACHGDRLQGSPLAEVAADRTIRADDRTVVLKKGTQVSCSLCHENPYRGGRSRSSSRDR